MEKQLEANTEGQGYIHYEIVIKHQNDEWGVWRRSDNWCFGFQFCCECSDYYAFQLCLCRYREFEQYSKNLYKCGVKPSMGVSSLVGATV